MQSSSDDPTERQQPVIPTPNANVTAAAPGGGGPAHHHKNDDTAQMTHPLGAPTAGDGFPAAQSPPHGMAAAAAHVLPLEASTFGQQPLLGSLSFDLNLPNAYNPDTAMWQVSDLVGDGDVLANMPAHLAPPSGAGSGAASAAGRRKRVSRTEGIRTDANSDSAKVRKTSRRAVAGAGAGSADAAAQKLLPAAKSRSRPRKPARSKTAAADADAVVVENPPNSKPTSEFLDAADTAAAESLSALQRYDFSSYINRPTKPKRPVTSYTAFVKSIRPAIMSGNPAKSFKEVAVLVAAEWRRLPPERQQPYKALSDADKTRFQKEKELWVKYESSSEDTGASGYRGAARIVANSVAASMRVGMGAGAGAGAGGEADAAGDGSPSSHSSSDGPQASHEIVPTTWKNQKYKGPSQLLDGENEQEIQRRQRYDRWAGPAGPAEKATVGTQTEEGVLLPQTDEGSMLPLEQ